MAEIEAKVKMFKIKWISSKFGNFKKDKVYIADAQFIHKKSKIYSGFRITDEDGDYYRLDAKDVGKYFVILNGGEFENE